MEQEENSSAWNDDAYAELFYFVEHMSGPWHPAEWQTVVNLLSQVASWDGERKKINPTHKFVRKSDLYMTTNYRMFIVALMNAEYFVDFESFMKFTQDAVSADYVYELFKAWQSLDCPMNDEHPYWREFEIETQKRDSSIKYKTPDDGELYLSDEYINFTLEKMQKDLEEE